MILLGRNQSGIMGVKSCRRQETFDLFVAILTVRIDDDNRKNIEAHEFMDSSR